MMTNPYLEYLDLMTATAYYLTGRPCRVRLKETVTKNSLGTVTIDPEGLPVVDVLPNLGQHTMATFLHELAHVKLHAGSMEKSTLDRAPARSYQVSQQERQPTWENAADQLRDLWLQLGEREADPNEPDHGKAIMKALIAHYYKRGK